MSATATTPSTSKAEPVESLSSLYWYGTLPAAGEVKIKVHQTEYNEAVDGYFHLGETTAKKAWNGRNVQQWIGKCPDFQSLPVAGLIFNAWTERVVRQGDTADYATALQQLHRPCHVGLTHFPQP